MVAPWIEATDAGLGAIDELWAWAEHDGVHVVSGQPASSDMWDGQIWYSNDGSHWQSAVLPEEPHIDRIHAIASHSGGFVALGLEIDEETLTHSLVSADGRDWQPGGTYAGTGTYLAEINGRLLAFGNTSWPSDPWFSDDDAATWQELESESGLAVASGLHALHEADGYLWAVRSDSPLENPRVMTPIELWCTADGLEWTKVTDLPDSIAVVGATMTSGPLGWVIAARRSTFSGPGERVDDWFVWHSADGLDWSPGTSAPRWVNQIVSDPLGFIAIGQNPGPCCALVADDVRQKIWTSADGSAWRLQPQEGWHGREIAFITLLGDRVVGVGIDWHLAPGLENGWGVGWETEREALLP